jgi:protein SCO1/2
MDRRGFLVAGAAASAAPFFAPAVAQAAGAALHQSGEAWFTNVPLRTHEGRAVRFYDDLLKGKIVLINLMYTRCDNICPGATQNLAYVQELLAHRMGRDIFIYSISIDPQYDTPERLAAYAKSFGAGPGWLFLTADRRDHIELLRVRLGFKDSDPSQDANPDEHTGTIRLGNEPLHLWAMAPSFTKPELIVRSVRRLVPGSTRL